MGKVETIFQKKGATGCASSLISPVFLVFLEFFEQGQTIRIDITLDFCNLDQLAVIGQVTSLTSALAKFSVAFGNS